MKSLAHPRKDSQYSPSWQLRLRLEIARLWIAVDRNDALAWSVIFLCACYLFIRIAGGVP